MIAQLEFSCNVSSFENSHEDTRTRRKERIFRFSHEYKRKEHEKREAGKIRSWEAEKREASKHYPSGLLFTKS
jgi:hypothetical protein